MESSSPCFPGHGRAARSLHWPAAMVGMLFLTLASGHAFTALYVFGDSLSDTGRNPAPAPEYYNGRYSNGPLWVEYLSAELGIPYNPTNNFAVSGSTTGDLAGEIAGLTASTNLSTGLFTVLSGGNDFLQNATVGVNEAFWSNLVQTAVVNITNAADLLYAHGAREVVVPNQVSVGETPAFLGTPIGYPQYIDSKVALFNAELAAALVSVAQRDPGLRIYALDFNTAFNQFLGSPTDYGFTVVTNGALEDPNLVDKSYTGPGADYVFWDVIHPTTKAHALTADLALQFVDVQVSVVPSGDSFTLTASHLYPGLAYTIQTSPDLVTWSNYQTITASSTNATLAYPGNGTGNVFFRIQY